MITSAIAGVSDKDPGQRISAGCLQRGFKNFHKSPAYQRLPNTPEDAKKEKRTIRMLIFPMMRTRMTIRMISCHGPLLQEIIDAAPTLECQG